VIAPRERSRAEEAYDKGTSMSNETSKPPVFRLGGASRVWHSDMNNWFISYISKGMVVGDEGAK